MSNLTEHAKKELEAVGMFDKDADYGGMLGDAVMELIETFAKQGHSGMSASITIQLFTKLAKFENLTPLTDNPDEWMNVAEMAVNNEDLWQSRRKSTCFSKDGGKTYYDIDDKKRKIYTSKPMS